MKLTDDQYPFEVFAVGDLARINERRIVRNTRYTFDDVPVPQVVIVGAQAGSPKMKAGQKTRRILRIRLSRRCAPAFQVRHAGLP
jgi:hypothetical protein